MAKRPDIPQSADELTSQWFSSVTSQYGGRVVDVRTEEIGEGIGFMGEIHRCHLTWDGAQPDAPRSVIAKIPSQVEKNRSLGESLQVYQREIVVYSQLRNRLGVPMPVHVHSALDKNPVPWLTRVFIFLFEKLPIRGVSWVLNRLVSLGAKSRRRYLLVMEDIADARPPSQIAGGSVDDALAGLRVLARFHAANWMATDVLEEYPIVWPVDLTPKVVQASYRRNREVFMERFGERLGPAMVAKMDQIQDQLGELITRLTEEPWTLLHGDYRLDNLMFRPDGEIVVLDWQGLGYGSPGWDVAYFITTTLEPHHRDEEELMLRTYHEALLAAGVADYSYDRLIADTTLTKEILVHRMVAGDDLLDTDANGDEALVDLLVQRIAGWVTA